MKDLQNHQLELLIEIKKLYDNVMDETIDLIKQYNCKTPLEIYCLFNMINNSYTKGKELFNILYENGTIPTYSRELETRDIKGIQTVLNSGVYRHRTSMLNDIYKRLEYESVMLYGYAENLLKNEEISSNIEKINDDYYTKSKKFPNHVVVMVGNDKKYYLDPIKDVTYYKNDEDKITLRNNLGLYFFSDIKVNKFFWGHFKGINNELEIYNKIMEKPCSNELENIEEIKEIYSHLKQYKFNIEKFVRNTEKSISNIKEKSLIFNNKY